MKNKIDKYVDVDRKFIKFKLILEYSKLWEINPCLINCEIDYSYGCECCGSDSYYEGYSVRTITVKRQIINKKKFINHLLDEIRTLSIRIEDGKNIDQNIFFKSKIKVYQALIELAETIKIKMGE